MNPVELIENQEIGPENAAHEISLFSHHGPALEGAVCIEKEALEGGGGVYRPKIERYEGPHQVRLPEGWRKNQTHQGLQQILVPVQHREILNGLEEFRSFFKFCFKAFCKVAPIFEIAGNIPAPELDKGS
jgi:hypothetical protein